MEDEYLVPEIGDRILGCCLCRELIQQAVQLTCLHNSCRKCFSRAAANESEDVRCGLCRTTTRAGTEMPNNLIACEVQRHMAAAESKICDACKENGEPDKPALVWCDACQHSLCEDCSAKHRQYKTKHTTQSLQELEEMYLQPSAPVCAIHKKPVDIVCRNCQHVKCVVCCEECVDMKHEVCIIDTKSFESYLDNVIASISAMENALFRRSEALANPHGILRELKEARARQLKEIEHRKRRIMDAVEKAFNVVESSTKNAYDELEGEANEAAAEADQVALDVWDASTYVGLLVKSGDKYDIISQQNTVQDRLKVLSAQVDALVQKLERVVNINMPLPDDLDNIIREWIGEPVISSVSQSPTLPTEEQPEPQQQSLSFGAASANYLAITCSSY